MECLLLAYPPKVVASRSIRISRDEVLLAQPDSQGGNRLALLSGVFTSAIHPAWRSIRLTFPVGPPPFA